MDSRHALLSLIAHDPALSALYDDVRQLMDDDPGHDLAHVLRVALWTLRIGAPDVDPRHAIAAALLHDIVNVPKDSPDRARASELCAAAARDLLARHGFEDDEVADICEAIRDHSYSRGATPRTPLGKALQDADRLEAVGAIGICRTISTGTRMGAHYFDTEDPWARERPLDDRRFSVDHFFTKLLRLPATMNTAAGRAEAERRADLMRAFLLQLGDELGEPPPELP